MLPGRRAESSNAPTYNFEAFVIFLASRLDALKPLFRHRVEKRVGLHEHPGVSGVTEAAVSLLRAIPASLDDLHWASTQQLPMLPLTGLARKCLARLGLMEIR